MELTHGALVVADLAGHGSRREPGLLPRAAGAVHVVGGHGRRGLGRHRARAACSSAWRRTTSPCCRRAPPSGSARRGRCAGSGARRPRTRARSSASAARAARPTAAPDDVYRLRAYETTATIPRFNNSATQVTVVVLQNTTDRAGVGQRGLLEHGRLAAGDGTAHARAARPRRRERPASFPALAGQSGSITITHDGAYGALARQGGRARAGDRLQLRLAARLQAALT